MAVLYVILGIVLGTVALWQLQKWLDKKPLWHKLPFSRAQAIMNTTQPVFTPEAHKVYYEPGVGPVDLPAVDTGFNDTMARLGCQGYPIRPAEHILKVVVLKSELSPEMGVPSFRVPIRRAYDPYFDSEWDMMRGDDDEVHYVLAAGMTVAIGQPYGDVVLIPYSANPNDVKLGVDHEMEHVGLSWYDGARAEANQYHQQGPHPFIPPCPGFAELVSETHPSANIGITCVLLTK